ncbi:kinesin-13A-like isoform X1 [Micractinium conductrix]|uniref:Kinesin-like protein n=1 Tax=Micractinium conductrix TaxID=554055 RepID=A0A2P6V3Y4_9CHLO|nr:kinesin-13A-like isoform X1 [Micractinium conductrix]|eukprot:PSC68800.1 kinesin-13A-like isoform X1 [Micractinium conductrix]
MTTAPATSQWLDERGLGHLTRAIGHLSLSQLKALLLSDYERVGVASLADRQALFRALQLAPSPQLSPQPSATDRVDDDVLVDLDGDDDDFLTQDLDLDQEFLLSPAPPAGAPGGNAAAAAPAHLLATLQDAPKIRVIVRKRPLNKKETERGENDVLECDAPASTLFVNEPKVKVDLTKYTERHAFRFDDVFDERVDNSQLYEQAVQPLVGTIFRGGKGTCFAYGQTGSGKTYTMSPLPLRAAGDIFGIMAQPAFEGLALHVSCYEIYGGKVFDLLNGRKKLDVREDGRKRVQVVGLREVLVGSLPVLQQLTDHAAAARSTGSTGANDESSRSHSILCFALRTTTEPVKTVGKLSFIDLAGSERGADTYDNDKQTRLEGAEINKSLLALKECIRALDADARHIPFRGSKLTEVLRDSFVGKNARTVMIANVSPNSGSCEHTLNTLRYADRVKEIRKPGSAPGNAGAAAVTPPALPATSGFVPVEPVPPPRQLAAQPAALPVGQQHAAEAAAVAASRAAPAPASRVPNRYGSRREGTGIPAPVAAPPPTAPPASTYQEPAAAAPVNWQAALAPAAGRQRQQQQQQPAPVAQQDAWGAAPPAASTSGNNDVLSTIMAAEDELITSHRQHIEECMGTVREEMNLLANLDGSSGGGDIERYCSDLSALLSQKQASLSQLQLRLHAFQQLMRSALQG